MSLIRERPAGGAESSIRGRRLQQPAALTFKRQRLVTAGMLGSTTTVIMMPLIIIYYAIFRNMDFYVEHRQQRHASHNAQLRTRWRINIDNVVAR